MLRLRMELLGPRPARVRQSRETHTRLLLRTEEGALPPLEALWDRARAAVAEESSPRPSSSRSRVADAPGSAPGRRAEPDLNLREEGGAVVGPPRRSAWPLPAAREHSCRCAWRSEPREEELTRGLIPCSANERLLCVVGFTDWHISAAERGREDFVMMQMNFCDVSTTMLP